MVTMRDEKPARAALSRQLVLQAALDHVDQHGLEALSMHKLGAALGVKAMSLYKHVADKDDILDGIVDLQWEEIPAKPPADDWRDAIRWLAAELRDLVHRHPQAAPLLTSRQDRPGLRERPLLIAHNILRQMREDGVPERCAVALLRTVFPYGIGYALAELSLPPQPPPGPDREIALIRQVTGMLSPQASDELVRTALLVCGDCDMTDQFRIGVDLMLGGLDAYLTTLQESTPGSA
jgi:AcrR family transcriptional regulator